MNFADRFFKPEYWFQPGQVWRRLRRRGPVPQEADLVTPWGLPMHVRPNETVGHAMWHLGILDLVACEVCWRLLDPGELALDVGANIGVMTGLLACRSGQGGEVWSFEPHPIIHRELARHVEAWKNQSQRLAKITLCKEALSDSPGEAQLFESAVFAGNHGAASLEQVSSESGRANTSGGQQFVVTTITLDKVLPADRPIGLLKIDVEGHEPKVFTGATATLAARRIRDIVFEEHHAAPSPTMKLLTDAGYTILFLGRSFFGPILTDPADQSSQLTWLPPNFLATLDPERALARCRSRGWQVLR